MKTGASWWARKRRAYAIVGRCTRCGKPHQDEQHRRCAACREKYRIRMRNYRATVEIGAYDCSRCGQPDPAWFNGPRTYRYCLSCRDKAAAGQRRRYVRLADRLERAS